jgi:hypothetical protein
VYLLGQPSLEKAVSDSRMVGGVHHRFSTTPANEVRPLMTYSVWRHEYAIVYWVIKPGKGGLDISCMYCFFAFTHVGHRD